jgi:hypothetical protein
MSCEARGCMPPTMAFTDPQKGTEGDMTEMRILFMVAQ